MAHVQNKASHSEDPRPFEDHRLRALVCVELLEMKTQKKETVIDGVWKKNFFLSTEKEHLLLLLLVRVDPAFIHRT